MGTCADLEYDLWHVATPTTSASAAPAVCPVPTSSSAAHSRVSPGDLPISRNRPADTAGASQPLAPTAWMFTHPAGGDPMTSSTDAGPTDQPSPESRPERPARPDR